MLASDKEFDRPEFLARLRAGDGEAYRLLIRRFHGALVGTAGAIIGSRAHAEEVVQDAWLAVFANIGKFEGRSTLASWLFAIVLNRARTRASREGRLVPLITPEEAQNEERAVPLTRFLPDGHWAEAPRLWDELDPERVVGGQQLWAHVQAAIERLPAGQKAVIILRDMEGQSAEEACALLSISAENQRVLLHRARGRVRAALEQVIDGAAPAAARTAVPVRPARGKPSGGALGRFVLRVFAWLWPVAPAVPA
jgi:RNA polymerase sigma-70 factor, ECF subfamily